MDPGWRRPQWALLRGPSARTGGFTLLELLVGTVVSSIILLAVAAVFTAVQASYHAESEIKFAVEGARTGVSYLERLLRHAGYGLEPRFAFDFGAANLPGTTKDNFIAPNGAYTTDDLAFRYRDPSYLRRGSLDSGGGLLTLETGQTFGIGIKADQPVIAACQGGQDHAVLRTTEAKTAADASVAVAAYGAPFPTAVPQCVRLVSGTQAAFVMLSYDVRMRVVALGGRPFLVVFHSRLSGGGAVLAPDPASNSDFDPIAAEVENFQVAYVMSRPPPTSTCCAAAGFPAVDAASTPPNWILGDAAGEPMPSPTDTTASWPTGPTYETAYDDAARYNTHPANIRMVRVNLAVRSARREPQGRQAFGPLALENFQPVSTAPDGYYRTSMSSAIRAPNLTSRSFFIPPLKPSPTDPLDLNVSGG